MKNKTHKLHRLNFATEPIAAGAIVIFGAIGAITPFVSIGALATTGFSAWQNRNFQRFREEIEKKLKAVEKEKIDQGFIVSDEFKALVVQGVEAAVRSASEERCHALSNAILSSAILPTSKFSNKQAIIRTLAQLTDEEIHAIKALNRYHEMHSGTEEEATYQVTTKEIAERITCTTEEALVTCDGLIQLGLAYDAEGINFDSTGQHRQIWRITALGRRTVEYATEKV